MKKTILSLIFSILSLSIFGQKRLFSPFKLTDYENLKNEYINATVENDSLLLLVNNYYLIKSKLDSIPNIENNLKSIFKISKNDFTYYYKPNHNELYIEFPNNDLKIVYWFQGDTNSEFINNEKIRTWNIYFTKNGQLKKTNTNLLSNNDAIGISEEYNIIGARLFYANWSKDFKLTKQQVKKISEKFLSKCFNVNDKRYFLINEEEIKKVINNKLNEIPAIYKDVNDNREAIWFIIYDGLPRIEMKIFDKTSKFIECEYGFTIE